MNNKYIAQINSERERKFTGVFIPKIIYLNPEINANEKLLLTEINSLDKLGNGCRASNEHFCLFLGVSKPALSKYLAHLKTLGFIEISQFNGRSRVITIYDDRIRQSYKFYKAELYNLQGRVIKKTFSTNNIRKQFKKTCEEKTAEPSSPYKQLMQVFYDGYKQRFNINPDIDAAEGKALKSLIKKYDPKILKELIEKYLSTDDPFYEKQGYTLRFFQTAIKSLRLNGKKKDPFYNDTEKVQAVADELNKGKLPDELI